MTNKLNELQKQKLDLQIELSIFIHSSVKDQDKINELEAEILYLDKQIEKIVGKNEIERRNELKKKKSNIDSINKSNYYSLKLMVKKISPMTIATNRMVSVIDKLENTKSNDDKARVKK